MKKKCFQENPSTDVWKNASYFYFISRWCIWFLEQSIIRRNLVELTSLSNKLNIPICAKYKDSANFSSALFISSSETFSRQYNFIKNMYKKATCRYSPSANTQILENFIHFIICKSNFRRSSGREILWKPLTLSIFTKIYHDILSTYPYQKLLWEKKSQLLTPGHFNF